MRCVRQKKFEGHQETIDDFCRRYIRENADSIWTTAACVEPKCVGAGETLQLKPLFGYRWQARSPGWCMSNERMWIVSFVCMLLA